MSDFQFRLEKLLELRARDEERAAGRLADARLDERRARVALDAIEEARETGRAELAALHSSEGRAGRLQAVNLVLDKLKHGLSQAEQLLEAAQEHVHKMREEFSRAHRDRRALDELKARRRDAWSRENARNDQRELDDVAVNRHARGPDRSRLPGGEPR